MVEVGLMVSVTTLVVVIVLIWRIEMVKATIHDRVDEIDRSLGTVVGMLIEKLDSMADRAVSITENPIGQLIEFFKSQRPDLNDGINTGPSTLRDSTSGQFVEVEAHAPTKEKEN